MTVPVTVTVERNVEIPLRPGFVLRADVYRDEAASPTPTLLQYTAYDKDNWLSVFGVFSPFRAVERGFTVVVVDAIGRFASDGDGPYRPFSNDADGATACISWIIEQDWSNGRVGMYGASNSGVPVLQAARRRPEGLASIVPQFTTSEFDQGWVYRGGAFQFGFNAWWTLVNLAPDLLRRAAAAGDDTSEAWAEWTELFADPDSLFARDFSVALGAVQRFTPHYDEWVANPPGSTYWSSTSLSEDWGQIDLPALHVAGWFNVHLDGNLAVFEEMRRASPARDRQYLLIGPWTQWMPAVGEMCGPEARFPAALMDMAGHQLDWFEATLAGSGDLDSARSRVRVFVMGIDRWSEYSDWPPSEGTATAWFLSSTGRDTDDGRSLDLSGPAVDAVADHFVHDPSDPVPTLGGATMLPAFTVSAGPRDQRDIETRDDVLVFSGPLLTEPVTVVGPVTARLYVSSDAESVDVTAKLIDVHPDGRAMALCDGIVRTDAASTDLSNPTEIVVDLIATGNCFGVGHRIRLEVAGSNFPKFDLHCSRDPHSAAPLPPSTAHRISVHSGGETPSALVLHVVPDAVPD